MANRKIFLILVTIILLSSCKQIDLTLPLVAKELASEYQKKKMRSNRRYKYKEIIVEGKMNTFYENDENKLVIILGNKNAKYAISCTMKKESSVLKRPLVQNEILKIKGICIGIYGHVELKECDFVK